MATNRNGQSVISSLQSAQIVDYGRLTS